MDSKLYSKVSGGFASDPKQLPFEASHPDGRIFTDLAGQYDAGHLTLRDLINFGFYPAKIEDVSYDPSTEVSTEMTYTIDENEHTVAFVRGKRKLTEEEIAAREAALNPIPDNPTLGDWRVAMVLWNRLDEIVSKIKDLVESGNPMGRVVQERVEYSNNVLRSELMTLRGALGFSAEDVDESLWRADRVRQGDLSGVWPLQDNVPAPVSGEPEQPAEPAAPEEPSDTEAPVEPAEPEATAA